jgi:predicted MPP superfamily phosphohydrolase
MSRGGSVQERSAIKGGLAERLKPRLAVEEHFARLGHTYRHGKAFRLFDHYVIRPGLKIGLKAVGLYQLGRRNSLNVSVRKITLHYPTLPPAFDGFRVLHLSDFHIDGVDGLAEKLASILRGVRSDLCVFTGDYRFEDRGPCGAVYPRMRTVVDAISVEHGIWGILGNHDSAEIAWGLEELGVRMLVNEGVEIRRGGGSVWLAGVDDPFDYRCHDLATALADAPVDAFKILLAHAPEIYQDAAERGVHLYLSGHTHGGQIRLPGIGAIKHNSHCPKEFAYGLWKYEHMQGYTTSGVGCSSVPVRFGCAPEIVIFELKRGGEAFEKP